MEIRRLPKKIRLDMKTATHHGKVGSVLDYQCLTFGNYDVMWYFLVEVDGKLDVWGHDCVTIMEMS